MTKEQKMEIFNIILKEETLAGKRTYDGVNHADVADGAFQIVKALGLGSEYVKWSFGREWKREKQ